MTDKSSPHIGILCPGGAPLVGGGQGNFGGLEMRALRYARGLAERGWEVTFVVSSSRHGCWRSGSIRIASPRSMDPRGRQRAEWVARRLERTERFPWIRLRSLDPRLLWRSPLAAIWQWRAHRRLAVARDPEPGPTDLEVFPDAWIAFGNHLPAAQCVALARSDRLPSILMVASDHDLDERYQMGSTARGAYDEPAHATGWTLAHANQIVVQTSRQKQILAERFGREGTIIRNPIDLDDLADTPPQGFDPGYALWVGRSEQAQKRPLECLGLARRCPETRFVVVCNPRDPVVGRRLESERPENVTLIDRVDPEEMERYFLGAAVFLNTSAFEGFPNTFLQAGKYAVPVLSLEVDPDGVLAKTGGGRVCGGDLETMSRALESWMADTAERDSAGRRWQAYVRATHDLRGRVEELAGLLERAVDSAEERSRPPRS